MSNTESYEGWANRETWAVALHINNDQGWQESVHAALRTYITGGDDPERTPKDVEASDAGEIIRESVEEVVDFDPMDGMYNQSQILTLRDIGSLWRVDWTELGAAFLADLQDE